MAIRVPFVCCVVCHGGQVDAAKYLKRPLKLGVAHQHAQHLWILHAHGHELQELVVVGQLWGTNGA